DLIDRDLDRRAAAAAQVQAQDRRHLPPNLGTETLGAAATMHGALRALGLIARADLIWVLPAATGIGWLLFGITDLVTVISRLSAAELTQMSSPLRWQQDRKSTRLNSRHVSISCAVSCLSRNI